MCGIGGYSGAFPPTLLREMNRVMAYRGPDDEGVWSDPSAGVGLCHRRLSIIDLSPLGKQPMWDVSLSVAIVFNGEIYNFRELREELLAQGFSFTSQTDTEVLLNLYLRDGEAMLPRLNGMFAFAIWDTRTRSLFLARDALGVKPLYYTASPSGFLFASALQCLLCDDSIARSLDSTAIFDYLTLLYAPAPRTMFGAISKLEPGHALRVGEGRIYRKWQWQDLPIDARPFAGDERAAAATLREKLEIATARQMVADVPVGAFLSGGLDSSSLVAYASKYTGTSKLECFTIGFRGKDWELEGMTQDLPYARDVANHLGVSLNVVEAGPEIVDLLYEMIYHLDEPQADPAALHVRTICGLARERGIKVLLSGTGGDDLFSGYRRHDALMAERYWTWLPGGLRQALAFWGRETTLSSPVKRRLAKVFSLADRDDDERIASYFHWIDPLSRNHLLSSPLRATLMDQINRIPLLEVLQQLPRGMNRLNKMLYLDQKHFLTDHNLNYTDKMSMAESVEVRVPFLDPDLIAFSWSLPPEWKHRYGQGKWIFKKAMEPILPRRVIYRTKTGFGAPLRRWLHHELREVVEEHLSDESIRGRGLFDAAGVRRLIAMDKAGKVDGAYTIFSLLCIEIWCRLFLDGEWRRYTGL
jgi:asparagine synthase (glutamine-hydrolysing)